MSEQLAQSTLSESLRNLQTAREARKQKREKLKDDKLDEKNFSGSDIINLGNYV
jgi:hypothetical protein